MSQTTLPSSGMLANSPAFAAGAAAPADPHQYIRPGGPLVKGFGYNFGFETGLGYLSGLTLGGAYGATTGLHQAATKNKSFTLRLKLNQIINSTGKSAGQTANSFGVFAMTYSLTRDVTRFWIRESSEPDPLNEAIGAGVAGTLQGIARMPTRIHGLGAGLAIGGITYVAMKYGMDTIKKLPFEKL